MPSGLEAEQEYWPEWLKSVCKIFNVATLSTNDVCRFSPSLKSTPSLYQHTWMGAEPFRRQVSVTGNPTVCSMSFNCLAKDGGSWRSVGRQVILEVLMGERRNSPIKIKELERGEEMSEWLRPQRHLEFGGPS